jgi:hypothetical protein
MADNSVMKQQQLLSELNKKEFGKHNLMAYNNVADFRRLYVSVCKERLENNEIVVILPYYEQLTLSSSSWIMLELIQTITKGMGLYSL